MTRQLRSTDSMLRPAVRASVTALKLGEEDRAAVLLAERYAEMIDQGPALIADLGPKLLATLDALGATPRSRRGAAAPSRAENRLQVMRNARSA